MAQHCIAGLLLLLIGGALAATPHRIWRMTESRKRALRLPEDTFVVIARLVGGAVAVTGVLVFFLGH